MGIVKTTMQVSIVKKNSKYCQSELFRGISKTPDQTCRNIITDNR
jgi:hypothetical protein